MAGIPGLRDMWGAIGDTLDWVGDAASDALKIVASPFVDEEGELFGFIGVDDLETSYKKFRQDEKNQSGSKAYAQQGIAALNEQVRQIQQQQPAIIPKNVTEPYPNYNVQALGMKDFRGTVESILKDTESQVEKLADSIVMGKNIPINTSSAFVEIPEVNIKLPDVLKGD